MFTETIYILKEGISSYPLFLSDKQPPVWALDRPQTVQYNCITSHNFTSFPDHLWRLTLLFITELWSFSPQQCRGQVPVAPILLFRPTFRPSGIHTLPHPSLNNFLLPSMYLQFRCCPARWLVYGVTQPRATRFLSFVLLSDKDTSPDL